MALACTLLASGAQGWDTGADTSFVASSLAPGTDCALVLCIGAVQNSSSAVTCLGTGHTVVSSGSGPTWTKRTFADPSVGNDSHSCVWTAVVGGSSPGTFNVTATFPNSAGAYAYSIHKLTGHDTGTTFGGKIATRHQAGNGAVTATLDAAPATGDITVALDVVDVATAGGGATFGTGTWTQTAAGAATPDVAWNTGYRTGSTSTSVPWTDVNGGDGNNTSAQTAIVVKVASAVSATATPAAIVTAVTIPQSVLAAGSTVAPAAITVGPVVVPQASKTAGATVTPAALTAGPIIMPTVTVSAGVLAAPAAITAGPVTIPQAVTQAGAVVSPTVLTVGPVVVPAASASGSSTGTATPAAIAAGPVVIPQAAVAASSLAAPAVIPTAVTFPGWVPGYVTFPGTGTGNFLSTPDAAALEVTKLTLVVKVRPTTWTPAAAKYIATRTTGGNTFRFALSATSGALFLETFDASLVSTSKSSAAYIAESGVVNGDWLWLAASKDPDDGANHRVTRMYWSRDGTTWTQFFVDSTTGATNINTASTSPLQVGAYQSGTLWGGDIGYVSMRDGVGVGGTVGGTEVFGFYWDDLGTVPAANWFTAGTGQMVTVNHSGGTPTVIVPTVPSVTTQGGATVSPAALSLTLTLPAAVTAAGVTVPAAVIPLSVTVPQAAATGAAAGSASPAAITLNVTVPQTVVAAGAVTSPAATVLAVTIPQAVTQAGATVSPAVLPLTVAIPAAAASGASTGTATPNVITTSVTIPQATPLTGSTVTPAATVLTVTMPAALPQVSKTATPAVIPLTVTMPAATASGTSASTATPNAIALVTFLPSPTLTYGYVVNPNVIALAVSIGAAIATAAAATTGATSTGTITAVDSTGTITVVVTAGGVDAAASTGMLTSVGSSGTITTTEVQ